jgi:hypothetical protein
MRLMAFVVAALVVSEGDVANPSAHRTWRPDGSSFRSTFRDWVPQRLVPGRALGEEHPRPSSSAVRISALIPSELAQRQGQAAVAQVSVG